MEKYEWAAQDGTYCLFCIAGSESRIVKQLMSLGYWAMSPSVVRMVKKNGASVEQVRRL